MRTVYIPRPRKTLKIMNVSVSSSQNAGSVSLLLADRSLVKTERWIEQGGKQIHVAGTGKMSPASGDL